MTESTTATAAEKCAETAEPSLWKRALLMVVFAVILRLVELVLGLIMLVQFITKMATGKTIPNLLEFGANLSTYVAQIVRFQTFNTEERPYPFSAWPGSRAESPAQPVQQEQRVEPAASSEGGSATPA